jgi:molybdenum cofactor synthesis domain-containing protein
MTMRPFTATIPFADARAQVMAAAVPTTRVERVRLADADNRVAAADVGSAVDVPPFSRAAMDGCAVMAADTAGAGRDAPRTLTCIDRVFTGQMPSRRLEPGTCIEIATGAVLPDGADAVVMVEETTREGDVVRVLGAVSPGQNVGRQGADLSVGQVVIAAGQVLNPARIGALAATGIGEVDVFARPSVAIFSTGDELALPGQLLGPGQIYDINRFTLEAIVGRHGGTSTALPIVGDSIEALGAALDAAGGHDIIVTSGGSSVGERDLMLDALRARGSVQFHGIAVKPGKPTAFGSIGDTPVFLMPGYPTSCLSNGYLLLAPFLRAVAHLPPWEPRSIRLRLTRRIASANARHQFYTVRLTDEGAEPAFKASGDITSMAHADGYIEIPAGTDVVEAGTVVGVTLFA